VTRRLVGISVVWIPLAFLTDGITVLALPLLLGGNATAIGLASFAGIATGLVVQLAAGAVSDRTRAILDRRGFIAIATVPALIGLGMMGAGVGAMAAYVLVQLGAGAVQAGQGALIPEAVAPTARGQASGLKTAFDVGGSFLAFLVLGAALADGNLPLTVAESAGILVVAVAVLWLLGPAARGPGAIRPATGDDSVTSARSNAQAIPAGFLPLVASRFLLLFGTYAVGRFLVLLVADRTGQGIGAAVGDAAAILAFLTLLTAAAGLPAGWAVDRVGSQRLMVGGAIACAAGTLALIADAGIAGVLLGGSLMSLGTAAFVSANWAATTRLVPAAAAGRLMAIAGAGTGVAAATAGLLGPLIEAAGQPTALVVAAVAALTAIVPIVRLSPVATIREATT
jgi:MFS family permease